MSAAKESSIVSAAKTAVVGGAVFLIPGFVVAYVLSKVFGMLRSLAVALGPRFGIRTALGGILLDLAVVVAIVFACLVAGLLARRAAAQRMHRKLDAALLDTFPGYTFVKGLIESIRQSEEAAGSLQPVLLRQGESWRVAFATDRSPDGTVTVYLPGAPNPWSGIVLFVPEKHVRPLGVTVTEAIRINRMLGRGSAALVAGLAAADGGEVPAGTPAVRPPESAAPDGGAPRPPAPPSTT